MTKNELSLVWSAVQSALDLYRTFIMHDDWDAQLSTGMKNEILQALSELEEAKTLVEKAKL